MRRRPENLEPAQLVGYLGGDDLLYCSRDCASAAGQAATAAPVDRGEYQLVERGRAGAGQLTCPVCGSEFPIDWAGDEDRP
jgi:hypothetical protein